MLSSQDYSFRSLLFPQYLIPSFLPNSTTNRDSIQQQPQPPVPPSPSPSPSSKAKNKQLHDQPNPVSPSKSLTNHTSYIRCITCGAHLCFTSQIISKGFTGRHGRAYLVSAQSTSPDLHEQFLRRSSSSSPSTSPSTSTLQNQPQPQNLPNTHLHRPVSRQLVTGAHTVSDISCLQCGTVLGWKYVEAEEESQRYKVGKFILETKKIISATVWEGDDERELHTRRGESGGSVRRGSRQSVINEGGGVEDGSVHKHEHEHEQDYFCGRGNDRGYDKQNTRIEDPADEIEFDSQDEDECEDLFAGIWSPGLANRRRSRKLERKPGSMAATMFGFS
ncbi:Uncharacterized protein PECH_001818 [Penicillium ucsense]|uniref:Yippee domain-containing protein n=1 Tax=Penicillium ucsense TaxID=2839758 RepID=A0A8J8WN40_9EURO|nr:Uncharacterized protein PECM_008116 [Penicillium ucsense]KAF7738164.1 Uncharacterized protein PECH_001818 [Penicillium ucsense]